MAEPLVSAWARWRDKFAMMIDPRFYTLEWLDDELQAGRLMLLENERAAILVSLRTYPAGAREIHGMAAVGEMADIVGTLIPAAEELGRLNGCIVGSIESRQGWARVMEPHGYRLHQVILRKEL